MFYFVIILSVFVIFKAQCDTQTELTDIAKLRKKLFDPERYDSYVRPVKNINDSLTVHIYLRMDNFLHVSLKKNKLTLHGYTCFEWVDEFLQWDPAEYNNLHDINVESSNIWLPDIVMFDGTAPFLSDVRAEVTSKGEVWWCPQMKIPSQCAMDLYEFPHDRHNCSIVFTTTVWSPRELKLVGNLERDSDDNDSSDKKKHTESDFRLVDVVLAAEQYNASTILGDFRFQLILERRTSSFYYAVQVPLYLILLLTLGVFFLPANNDKKISLASFNILLIVYMLIYLSSYTAHSYRIPKIVVFLSNLMIVQTSVVVASVILVNMTTLPMPMRPHRSVIDVLQHPTVARVAFLWSSPNFSSQDGANKGGEALGGGGGERENAEGEGGTAPSVFSEDIPGVSRYDTVKREEWTLVAQAANRVLLVLYAFVLLALSH